MYIYRYMYPFSCLSGIEMAGKHVLQQELAAQVAEVRIQPPNTNELTIRRHISGLICAGHVRSEERKRRNTAGRCSAGDTHLC